MSFRFDVSVLGDDELLRELRGMEKKVRRKVLSKGLREGVKVVLQDAKRHAAVDEHGRIPRGLTVRTAKTRRGKRLPRDQVGMAVVIDKKRFPEAFYAKFVFLGTKHIEAQRTLREALYVNSTRVFATVRTKMRFMVHELARESRARK